MGSSSGADGVKVLAAAPHAVQRSLSSIAYAAHTAWMTRPRSRRRLPPCLRPVRAAHPAGLRQHSAAVWTRLVRAGDSTQHWSLRSSG